MSERASAVRYAVNTAAYHRDQHRAWRRLAGWLAAGNLLSAAVLAGFLFMDSTVYITVAATPDGRLVPLTQLDERIMTDDALASWAAGAVVETFTLGHADWRRRLSASRQYFTDRGFQEVVQGLENSGFLDRLLEGYQVASAVVRDVPIITDVRVSGGRVVWELEFPFLVTFAAGPRQRSWEMRARLLVVRVPVYERPAGIAIEQLIANAV